MNSHRHATDRVDGTILAECPNECDVAAVVQYSNADPEADALGEITEVLVTCPECGDELDTIRYEESSEVIGK